MINSPIHTTTTTLVVPTNSIYFVDAIGTEVVLSFIEFGEVEVIQRSEIVVVDKVVRKNVVPAYSKVELTSARCDAVVKEAFKALVKTNLGKMVKMFDYIHMSIHNGFIKDYEIGDQNRKAPVITSTNSDGEIEDMPKQDYTINFTFESYDTVPILAVTDRLPGTHRIGGRMWIP